MFIWYIEYVVVYVIHSVSDIYCFTVSQLYICAYIFMCHMPSFKRIQLQKVMFTFDALIFFYCLLLALFNSYNCFFHWFRYCFFALLTA